MTDRTEALEPERAELVEPLENLAKVGFGYDINNADRKVLRQAASALRRIAAQDQEPLWLYEDDLPDGYPYGAMFEHSEVQNGVRMFPVYLSPQPAAGWDQAIEAAVNRIEDEISDLQAELVVTEGHDNVSTWKIEISVPDLQTVVSALRHNAPPDSGAGKSEPSNRILDGLKEALAVTKGEIPAAAIHVNGHKYVPDHGGADAGVGVKPLEWGHENATAHVPETWRAKSIGREYDIQRTGDGKFDLWADVGTALTVEDTLVAAKAAAQADYESRIRSALSKPAPVEQKDCEVCGGDCASANPPVAYCPVKERMAARPAPVAANASAEARLREALEKIIAIKNQEYGGDWDEIELARAIALEALSTHPHVSDCDKQGERTPSVFDECIASGRSCEYEPNGPRGERQCKYCGTAPSDRTADVTVEELAKVLRELGALNPNSDARALLDAFTVGRR